MNKREATEAILARYRLGKPTWWTIEAAARLVDYRLGTLYAWCRSGQVQTRKVRGQRQVEMGSVLWMAQEKGGAA